MEESERRERAHENGGTEIEAIESEVSDEDSFAKKKTQAAPPSSSVVAAVIFAVATTL